MNHETTDVSELIARVRQKLIEYGVQPHVAWQDYSFNYMPIAYFFQDHGQSAYDAVLLDQYLKTVRKKYDSEALTRKTYLSKLRAASRLREFCSTGDISHVCSEGNAKTRLRHQNEMILQEFLVWSEPLNAKTRYDMEWAIRQYLSWSEMQGKTDAMEIDAHSFSGFLALSSGKYKDSSLHNLQLYLKKFHFFLKNEKGLEIPFEFVLSIPIIRTKKIFTPLTQDEIKRIIAQIDRSTVIGKRDYAIILLAARCGLRGSDIINLKLKDIDWRADEIRLIQKKTGAPLAVPLLADAAEALKEYILNGRPQINSDFVFVRAMHPYHPFVKTVVLSHMLKKYQQMAGIERYAHDGRGFHSLRRALGKELTLAEVPVTITAQVLGHQCIDSAKQYISLDSEHLKDCALSLKGIEIHVEEFGYE